ncbi:hypothetical protein D3C84_1093910 [compost metagenome]
MRHLLRHVGGVYMAGQDHMDQPFRVGRLLDNNPSGGDVVLEFPRRETANEAKPMEVLTRLALALGQYQHDILELQHRL